MVAVPGVTVKLTGNPISGWPVPPPMPPDDARAMLIVGSATAVTVTVAFFAPTAARTMVVRVVSSDVRASPALLVIAEFDERIDHMLMMETVVQDVVMKNLHELNELSQEDREAYEKDEADLDYEIVYLPTCTV